MDFKICLIMKKSNSIKQAICIMGDAFRSWISGGCDALNKNQIDKVQASASRIF